MYNNVAFIEISGVCNARCTFCCTGNRTHKSTGFMSVELFDKILSKLSTEVGEAQLNLYNWGEPLIHPEFKEMIYTLLKYPQFTYGISTNAGAIQVFDREMLSKLAYLRISLPGYSQDSFDKISKQNFLQVRENIESIVRQCSGLSHGLDIYIDYHVYRFNEAEIKPAREFAEGLNVGFRTIYAYINDWKAWCGYTRGEGSDEYKALVEDYLFMDKYAKDIKDRVASEKKSGCPISELLTVNHRGEVMIGCCAPYDDERFVVGDFLDIPFEQIPQRINLDSALCRECMSLGFPYIEKIFYDG